MTNTTHTESFASLHARTAREILRQELARALAEIDRATHVAVGPRGEIYAYGTEADALAFADGLRGVKVRVITDRDHAKLTRHKIQAYRNS